MRISASYNFFNGDEHLVPSLRMMRQCVEHISLVWQAVSNSGEPMTLQAKQAMRLAIDSHLVDDVIAFEPDLTKERHENELLKRSAGLDLAKSEGFSHFLSMDADEFYRPHEFLAARELIFKNGWKSSSVETYLHLRRPIFRTADITCCCFITEIRSETIIGAQDFPCDHVDPTRKMTADADSHHHFQPDVIAMYHMNLVRRDLSQKLRNSTTRDVVFLEKVKNSVEQWRPGSLFFFPNKGNLHIKTVDNEFGTYDPIE